MLDVPGSGLGSSALFPNKKLESALNAAGLLFNVGVPLVEAGTSSGVPAQTTRAKTSARPTASATESEAHEIRQHHLIPNMARDHKIAPPGTQCKTPDKINNFDVMVLFCLQAMVPPSFHRSIHICNTTPPSLLI